MQLIYTTINHIARKALGLSNDEAVVCDLVHKLSHNRWCTLSRENMAKEVGISKRGLQKMISRLIDKKLIEKNGSHHLRTTNLYTVTSLIANEKREEFFRDEQSSPLSKNTDEQSSPPPMNKVHPPHEQSSPYTNIDTNNTDTISLSCDEIDFSKEGREFVKDVLTLDQEEGAINVQTSNYAPEYSPEDLPALVAKYKSLSLSNRTYLQQWREKLSEEKLDELAEACANYYVGKHFEMSSDDAWAAKSLSGRLEKSRGATESQKLRAWIGRENQFTPKNTRTNERQPTRTSQPTIDTYNNYAETTSSMASDYAERQRARRRTFAGTQGEFADTGS